MLKDIWNIMFFAAHVALVFVLYGMFGVPGTVVAIVLIIVFWMIKGAVAPAANLWPDRAPDDADWPKPVKSAGNALGAVLGWLLILSMGFGLIAAVLSPSSCSTSSIDTEYRAP